MAKSKQKQQVKSDGTVTEVAGQAAADAGADTEVAQPESALPQEQSSGDDQPQGEVVAGDDIDAPSAAAAVLDASEVGKATVESLPIDCDNCGKTFIAAGPEGTLVDGPLLFCSPERLAAAGDDAAKDVAAKAGATVADALEAGALEQAVAAGQAAADAGGAHEDVHAAVAGVLDVIVDAVAEQVDTDEPTDERPDYELLKGLCEHMPETRIEVRMRRGLPTPQLIAGLIVDEKWRAYPLSAVAEFGCLSYVRALAQDKSIHVRLVE